MGDVFTNMFGDRLWPWAVLALVPPAIITLYFLKLRRQPVEVPSTYLWSRTIEDLHVNSIWQRLRQNILLYLQLLLVLLVMLSLLRPGCQGTSLTGNRFVFLVDASASMSSTDVDPTRLDMAKKRIVELIDQMKSSDAAMIISFSNVAKVEQPFTDNRRLLRERVNQITPTNRTSVLNDALRAAAGLANPGRTSQTGTNDVQVADAMPATLYIFSDGGFAEVPDFSLGNLEPKFMKIGTDRPQNVGVVAFSVGRNPDRPTQQQAFARLENYGSEPISVEVELTTRTREGGLVDAQKEQVELGAAEFAVQNDSNLKEGEEPNTLCTPGVASVTFDLGPLEDGILKLEIVNDSSGAIYTDAMGTDNVAYAALSTPRRARVLLVSPGNEVLRLALGTDEATKLADLSTAEPSILETKAFEEQAGSGQYDLIIFDRCAPKKMPQSSTLFIAALPPGNEWTAGQPQGPPLIVDTDRAHPLLALVEFGNVTIAEGFAVKPPQGGTILIDSDIGGLLAIAPREGYEDAVLGFAILAVDKDGKQRFHTDWYKRLSFPVFLKNVLEYLGGNTSAGNLPTIQPGTPMILRSQSPVQRMTVEAPSGQQVDVVRESQGTFVYTNTSEQGIYEVTEGTAKHVSQRFAVNLFDARESDLHVTNNITLGYETVKGEAGVERSRQEWWKWLLIGGLGVLIFEWYVYNRRVYF